MKENQRIHQAQITELKEKENKNEEEMKELKSQILLISNLKIENQELQKIVERLKEKEKKQNQSYLNKLVNESKERERRNKQSS